MGNIEKLMLSGILIVGFGGLWGAVISLPLAIGIPILAIGFMLFLTGALKEMIRLVKRG